MADRPILFSAPMIRALLAGTKTQTRRLLKPQPPEGATFFAWDIGPYGNFAAFMTERNANADLHPSRLPAWRGDRLWVREGWYTVPAYDDLSPSQLSGEESVRFDADSAWQTWGHSEPRQHGRLRSSIHMPRWASRLTLTVTEVRVQRLHEISEADAWAEGMTMDALRWEKVAPDRSVQIDPITFGGGRGTRPYLAYRTLWETLHGPGSWEANPWVVAVSFDVRKGNIDGQ